MKKKKKQKNNKQLKPNNVNSRAETLQPSIRSMTKQSNVVSLEETKIYKKNLAALKEHYPELAKQISQTFLSKYKLVQDKPGKLPNLLIEASSRYYYQPDDPMQDAKEQVDELNLKNNRLAVFLGTGLGYELIYYIQAMLKAQNTSHILVIEKELEIFKAAMLITDLSSMISNKFFHFMVGLPEETLYVKLRNYLSQNSRFMFLKAMKPVYHSTSIMIDKDYYMKALKQLRESGAHEVLNYGNCPEDSLIGVRNMLENIDEIIFNPGINLLYNKFKGKPAVVVSTGPSLNKNKHLLKGLEDKALLVAADASLKVMMEMGVKPHLVTSLERTIVVKKLMEGFSPQEVQDIYYTSCPVIDKEVYQAYPGPRVIVYRNFDHFKWLGIDKGILNIQLSAGNMAFKIAEALGCTPIILIGQDLSYGEDGTTHALGTANTKNGMVNNHRVQNKIEVPGNNGELVLTNDGWYPCIKAYDLDLAGYNGTCINSTEGGAFFQGTKVMPFQEAINKYIQTPIHPLQAIEDNLSCFTTKDAESDYYNVSKLIDETISDMKAIKENCVLGIELYEKYKKELISLLTMPSKTENAKIRIKNIHLEMLQPKGNCSKHYNHTYQLFFAHIIQSFNIKFEMEIIAIPEKHECEYSALAETSLRNSEWYKTIGELADIALDILINAKEKLKENKPLAVASK